MKGIITSVLLAGCIICSASCKKELGYTGFESDRNETFTGEVMLSTDKAIYSPGESVTLTASTVPVGKIYIRYRHLGETVKEEAASSATWTWQTPAEDYMGYMVEMYQITDDGEEVILGTVGVDVSSDWSMFPRYGFLASFDVMTEDETNAIIDNLNRYHINGVQFQDWHYKHHWPLGGTRENPLESYLDIASRTTKLSTLKAYIEKIHSCGMKAIFYNLCFGALDDAAQDGVNERWYIFSDNNHTNKDVHALGAPFKSSIYLLDPANTAMCDETEAYLYAAARAQNVRALVRPALAAGKAVVCDRFVDSSVAYQGGGRALGTDEVAALNALAVGGTLPDITVYLRMEPDKALSRRLNASDPDRLERQQASFYTRTFDAYESLFAGMARVVTVDASQPIEAVTQAMLDAVDARLDALGV